jgi:DNA-binding response OmpR family regulator
MACFDKARGRMVGAQDYLTKPFTKDQLLKAVAAVWRGAWGGCAMTIHNVLVVDDSKTELLYLSDVLKRHGLSVRTAEGADEALKRLLMPNPT